MNTFRPTYRTLDLRTPTHCVRAALVALLALAPLAAQTVHYPNAQHAVPGQLSFPFYTPGAGITNATVRVQLLCPDAFLQQFNLGTGYVTRVGFSLGGAAPYAEFVLRAGIAGQGALGTDWNANLPDQRVQADLSGQTIVGGGTAANPVNEWVDFELASPFLYQPGDSIVVDLTTRLQTPNVFCTTTVGGGLVQRALNFGYVPGAPANSITLSGASLRFELEPPTLAMFGSGCAVAGGTPPQLSLLGAPTLGSTALLFADGATPNGAGLFALGLSRTSFAGAALPLPLGGGCQLLVAADAIIGAPVAANGQAVLPLVMPLDPSLRGTALFSQFGDFTPTAPGSIPFVLSAGGVLLLQ